MIQKEQAIELVAKFVNLVDSEISGKDGFEFDKDTQLNNSKQCGLIAINEAINWADNIEIVRHLNKIKTEIEKL